MRLHWEADEYCHRLDSVRPVVAGALRLARVVKMTMMMWHLCCRLQQRQ